MEKYSFTGKNLEEALDVACSQLMASKDEIIYTANEQKGGLFKGKKIVLDVIKKTDAFQFIKDFIIELTRNMGIDVNIESKYRDDVLNIVLYSDNNNLLIGKDGKNMNALSVVVRQVIYNEFGNSIKFNLDVGEYKIKHEKNIEKMVLRIAKDVGKSKVEAKLDPMNSYERRIVHNVLNDNKYVYTESFGEEPNRYVVIKPKED